MAGKDRRAFDFHVFLPDLSGTPLQLEAQAIFVEGSETLTEGDPTALQLHYSRAGGTLGVGLGYWGGAPDLLAMRLFDVLFAFPPILLAIALVAALGPSTVNLVLTIAVLTLPQFAVLARSATLALKPQDFQIS